MNFKYDEFLPHNPILSLLDFDLEIQILNLKSLAYIDLKYSSIPEMLEKIKEVPETLIEVLWYLIKDKNIFNFNKKLFKDLFLSGDIVENSKCGYDCLTQAIYLSMPLIKNEKRYKEIQQIKKAQNENQSSIMCYGAIYDNLANRYGLSLEDFNNLSLRQIHILLEKAASGLHKDLEIQAALVGKKLQPKLEFNDFTEEQEKENEDQAAEALKRLQEQYKKNQENKINGR
jgi:hypothetical protein